MCATGYYFLPESYIQHVCAPWGTVFILKGLCFLVWHLDLVAATLCFFTAPVKVVSRDLTWRETYLSYGSGPKVSRADLYCILFYGERKNPLKNPQCCLSSARYLGAAEGRKLYKNNPKAYECKGFLTLKLNFWIDRVHEMLTAIQWQEIVKGVRFSILILGTHWL